MTILRISSPLLCLALLGCLHLSACDNTPLHFTVHEIPESHDISLLGTTGEGNVTLQISPDNNWVTYKFGEFDHESIMLLHLHTRKKYDLFKGDLYSNSAALSHTMDYNNGCWTKDSTHCKLEAENFLYDFDLSSGAPELYAKEPLHPSSKDDLTCSNCDNSAQRHHKKGLFYNTHIEKLYSPNKAYSAHSQYHSHWFSTDPGLYLIEEKTGKKANLGSRIYAYGWTSDSKRLYFVWNNGMDRTVLRYIELDKQ